VHALSWFRSSSVGGSEPRTTKEIAGSLLPYPFIEFVLMLLFDTQTVKYFKYTIQRDFVWHAHRLNHIPYIQINFSARLKAPSLHNIFSLQNNNTRHCTRIHTFQLPQWNTPVPSRTTPFKKRPIQSVYQVDRNRLFYTSCIQTTMPQPAAACSTHCLPGKLNAWT